MTSHQTPPCSRANETPIITREEYGLAYDSGYSKTIGFISSRGASRDTSEDLAQAAWAKGWQYREQIRDPSKVEAWVNTIAFNLFRGSFRKAPTVELYSEDYPSLPRNVAETIDCQRLFARCSPSERKLIKGNYLAGYTSAELGPRLGLSAVAVRVRLLRLRRRLRAIMRPGDAVAPPGAFPLPEALPDRQRRASPSAAIQPLAGCQGAEKREAEGGGSAEI